MSMSRYFGTRYFTAIENDVFQTRMAVTHFVNEMPSAFLKNLEETVMIERKPLRFSMVERDLIG